MPHALEIARETLFADPNIGQEAVSIANGGAPLPVRVVAGVPMPSPTSATRGSGLKPRGSTCARPKGG